MSKAGLPFLLRYAGTMKVVSRWRRYDSVERLRVQTGSRIAPAADTVVDDEPQTLITLVERETTDDD